jgi:glycosyltransferase involved in cell wall biosynthesis
MRRILIDLTDLQSWSGHHGGTQRVTYGIAKEYFLLGDSSEQTVEFMTFVSHEKAFCKTSFSPIFERIEQQKANASAPANTSPSLSLQTRVKHRISPYVPETIRKNMLVRRSAFKGIATGLKVAKKGKHIVQRYAHSPTNTQRSEHIVFHKEDVVLILGKPWDSPNMEQVLTVQKEQNGFKLLQVIYDLIIPLYPHLHHPSLFKPYSQYAFEAIYASDLLLPISKSTERDLKKFANIVNLPVPETKVIRLADKIVDTDLVGEAKPEPRIEEHFIACIGTVEIRKNHTLLYYTYKLAAERDIKLPQLVIVGSRGWLTGDFQYLVEHDPLTKNKILILDNVDDLGLAWIYDNCLLTVYPSLYEGWGLPVAESLARGKVAIAANNSSIPEVGGDLVDYFSPYSPEDCLKKLEEYLNKDNLDKRSLRISESYKPTSWQETYSQVQKSLSNL